MTSSNELTQIQNEIASLKRAATQLKTLSHALPALRCNTDRILASLKMLELNFCDITDEKGRP